MSQSTIRKPQRKHSPKPPPKPPTLAEVQAVVRAWLAANHPDVEHATLSSCNRWGSGPELAEILGPPTDKAWFTNDLPPTEAQEKEREANIARDIAKHDKRHEQEEKILRQADDIDPQRRVVEWVARWANAVSLLNAIDEELQELSAAVQNHVVPTIHPDSGQVRKLSLAVHDVATDALAMPFRGTLPLSSRIYWRERKAGA